jgi:hypothetical protein
MMWSYLREYYQLPVIDGYIATNPPNWRPRVRVTMVGEEAQELSSSVPANQLSFPFHCQTGVVTHSLALLTVMCIE